MRCTVANKGNKHETNIAGKYYCTHPDDEDGEGCIACNVCYSGAEDFFAEDDMGNAYVIKQPTTDEEIELVEEQLEACPVASIGNDG
jgi:ferredoxin